MQTSHLVLYRGLRDCYRKFKSQGSWKSVSRTLWPVITHCPDLLDVYNVDIQEDSKITERSRFLSYLTLWCWLSFQFFHSDSLMDEYSRHNDQGCIGCNKSVTNELIFSTFLILWTRVNWTIIVLCKESRCTCFALAQWSDNDEEKLACARDVADVMDLNKFYLGNSQPREEVTKEARAVIWRALTAARYISRLFGCRVAVRSWFRGPLGSFYTWRNRSIAPVIDSTTV